MDITVSRHHDETAVEKAAASGTSVEALGGAAAVVLAIIGLAHIAPVYMVSIAAIVLGAALLFNGSLIAAEFSQLLDQTGSHALSSAELGGGVSGEALAGIVSVLLGILALIGLATPVLVAIAAIVLGVGVILGSGINARLNSLKVELGEEHEFARQVAHGVVSEATTMQVLVGIGAIVLGILALAGLHPMVLALVALLALGIATLLSGSALTARLFSLLSETK